MNAGPNTLVDLVCSKPTHLALQAEKRLLADTDSSNSYTRAVVVVCRRVKTRTVIPNSDVVLSPFVAYLMMLVSCNTCCDSQCIEDGPT